MSYKIKEMAEKRAELVTQMKEIQGKAADEKRPMDPDESKKFDDLDAEVIKLEKMIEEAKRVKTREGLEILDPAERKEREKLEKSLQRQNEDEPYVPLDRAISNWMRYPCSGDQRPSSEELEAGRDAYGFDPYRKEITISFRPMDDCERPRTVQEAVKRHREVRSEIRRSVTDGNGRAVMGLRDRTQQRAQGTTVGTEGGFTVADEFSSAIDVALLQFGGMRQVATVMRTDTGADFHHPTVNDTTNTGEWVGENPASAVTKQDAVFNELVLKAHNSSSKEILVSLELLQDTMINLLALLGRLLGERLGRLHNTGFTVGDAAAKPMGIVPAATSSAVTTASNTVYTFEELLDLKHTVDPAYRGVGAGFMGNDTTLSIMKKIQDDQSRPIWMPNLIDGEPDRFDGSPFTVNQDVASGASAKALLYGQFTKYMIREVSQLTLLRLDELYAEKHQAAFLAFMRVDGNLLDAGTNPVKFLTNAA
jgi:HK97 family phage major capsid protein